MSFLSISGIHHTYFSKTSAKTALFDVSMEIEEGEFVSFLGPSGCGKTTLLSIISGLLKPTAGKVFLEKNPISTSKIQIGYMLQQDYLFPWKTIEENILLGLKLSGSLTPANHFATLRLLNQMGISGVEDQLPKQLSGGMRQRVALVRTLATEPKLLLLDEPFSALDYQTKLKLEDLVSATLTSFGKTAILVSHDIGEAIAMSDRVILFSPGPGKIHRIFEMPESLKKLTPFEARNHEDFPQVFQTIWKELESLESGTN
ncbi:MULTISPECIES: ABC transporter ATP-binding protein [unclassified Bacillus (in: firmicutes)]|uniref:ABC transporter ATP-binding protein n=1 Tax=unclassified Bacillus (in: firmicutes) TaxID=185979 RepID=UPI0008E9EA61|nr:MULTISPECIES: ABC transporter ATP-binding protein [unclassified Bacillus (in: firmicutes)]SFB18311.1 NitT/TauT family transport system ATP-binding protein [Bacillus sp. UNCCL13]SFQ76147.1 NitT/TauT family transport system ATP-binding protein [Bacillus sp. cl95]